MTETKAARNPRGITLFMVLVVLVFLLPTMGYLAKRATTQYGFHVREKKLKMAKTLANNLTADLMRQFTENPYQDYTDMTTLTRYGPWGSFHTRNTGYAVFWEDESVTLPEQHSVMAVIKGLLGWEAWDPGTGLDVVIRFNNDTPRFALRIPNSSFSLEANQRVSGGLIVESGDLVINDASVQISSNAIVVDGVFTGKPGMTLTGHVYRAPSKTASNLPTGSGDMAFVPKFDFPPINLAYYKTHYNHVKETNSPGLPAEVLTWEVDGWKLMQDGVHVYDIPNSPNGIINNTGGIIYAKGFDVLLKGNVDGRLTVVSVPDDSNAGGSITVNGDITYAAASGNSIAVLAKTKIRFETAAANMSVSGLYYVEDGGPNVEFAGGGGTFTLTGSLVASIPTLDTTTFGAGAFFQQDPTLFKYLPPAIPQRPILSSWRPVAR